MVVSDLAVPKATYCHPDHETGKVEYGTGENLGNRFILWRQSSNYS